jgi:hypothetical protein
MMSINMWNKLVSTAAFGATSIAVGTMAMALAVVAHQIPEPPGLTASVAPDADAGHAVQTAVLPKLAGRAVFNWGSAARGAAKEAPSTVHAPGPKYVLAGNETPRMSLLRQASEEAPCHPSWRPLESGPVGRMVADRCRDQSDALPPPPSSVDPSRVQLPTVAEFVQPIVTQDLVEFGSDAESASRRLAAALGQTIEKPTREVAPQVPVPAVDLGTLDWAPDVLSDEA